MKNFFTYILICLARFSLWFRYDITVKGLENLNPETLNKSGGVLFLPNHPTVFVDPILVASTVWKKYPVRPMVVEYMYYAPVINWAMRTIRAIPVPAFMGGTNSFKKKKIEAVFETVIDSIKKGDNFLIYPAGRVKHQAHEVINASGVHRVVQSAPEANIVLVRVTGLWGSSFSRALTGSLPAIFSNVFSKMKDVFKNLIFFTPRRKVTIEFTPLPPDFNRNMSRIEFNTYLENWYNRPDGLTKSNEEFPGESLYLVSYSMWKEKLPEVMAFEKKEESSYRIPDDVQKKVKQKLFELTNINPNEIKFDMHLGTDLGLDSLDAAEILSFLDDTFDVTGVPVAELTTVGKLMGIAAGQVAFQEEVEEEQQDLSKWNKSSRKRERATVPDGDTLHEVFLNQCAQRGNDVACGDMRAGVITFSQARLRVLMLAEYIRNLPGEHIGILLPSSVAAYLVVLACQLAGKIPLLINWTVGPRHLETVVELSNVQTVLSSWNFIDRLENVNFEGIEDKIIMLEDVRRNFSISDKLKAFYRSKLSVENILKAFDVQDVSKKARAVLLFTSGTESMPKGVPLTHENILSNQRAALDYVEIYTDDVVLGILPPFHSFGFTVSGLLPLLAGIKVSYFPDPTDGMGVAKSVERWKATIICGAPLFLKGMFKNMRTFKLDTLRLCITGAEKAPDDLFQMAKKLEKCHLIEGYGITECSPILTINKEGNSGKGVGQPLPGVDLNIINIDTHQSLKSNQTGLILAKGPSIFSGYLNKSLSSPFLFVNGFQWYSTGDLGYLDDEGNLVISGRLKRFVKIGGEMISLAAVEEVLHNTIGQKATELEDGPILALCAKEEVGEKTRLFLFTRFDSSIDETNKALKEAGFSNLLKVSKVQQVSEIPIMGTGKVNYRALEAHLSNLVKESPSF